ncbi:MAG: VOC family protein [Pseudomonadota bacterium]
MRLDHLVVGAATLKEGTRWMSELLDCPPVGSGKHADMSTHNALWRIGSAYLEVIAIDPDAPALSSPRWYGLDQPETRERLAEHPRLLTWVVEPATLEEMQALMPFETGKARTFSRDTLSWRLTVPDDGLPPLHGTQPTLIAWDEGSQSPGVSLEDQGLQLDHIALGTDPKLFDMIEGMERDFELTRSVITPNLTATITRADGVKIVID